jgi:hypothetical protein
MRSDRACNRGRDRSQQNKSKAALNRHSCLPSQTPHAARKLLMRAKPIKHLGLHLHGLNLAILYAVQSGFR